MRIVRRSPTPIIQIMAGTPQTKLLTLLLICLIVSNIALFLYIQILAVYWENSGGCFNIISREPEKVQSGIVEIFGKVYVDLSAGNVVQYYCHINNSC